MILGLMALFATNVTALLDFGYEESCLSLALRSSVLLIYKTNTTELIKNPIGISSKIPSRWDRFVAKTAPSRHILSILCISAPTVSHFPHFEVVLGLWHPPSSRLCEVERRVSPSTGQ